MSLLDDLSKRMARIEPLTLTGTFLVALALAIATSMITRKHEIDLLEKGVLHHAAII